MTYEGTRILSEQERASALEAFERAARAPLLATLADPNVCPKFKMALETNMNAINATTQLLARTIVDMASPQPKKPARFWLSKCLTFEAASEVLQDYYATGEVTKDQDPDINFENGLWVVSIAEGTR